MPVCQKGHLIVAWISDRRTGAPKCPTCFLERVEEGIKAEAVSQPASSFERQLKGLSQPQFPTFPRER